MAIQVGDTAPDFTLRDSNRQQVTLSSFRGDADPTGKTGSVGKAVLVVFYPFAFSGTCTGEMCAIRDDLDAFQNERVQVLAVSTDPMQSLKAWSEAQGFTFPLLSDFWPHGAVAKEYGVFHEAGGMANRGTFLVGTDGIVTFAEVNGPGEPRDQSAWKRAVAALPS